MPSSFMVKRNYAHCPLKKRPLALYNEPANQLPEQTQPEDLSVKRPKLECTQENPEVPTQVCTSVPSTVVSPIPVKVEPIINRDILYNPPSQPQKTHTLPQFVPSRPPYSYGLTSNRVPTVQVQRNVHPTYIPPTQDTVPQLTPQLSAFVHRPEYQQRIEPTPHQATAVRSTNESGNLPSLAEYYLQLFKQTSEAEKKPEPRMPSHMPWHTPYLPPSPQASPVTPDQIISSQVSPTNSHLLSPQPYTPYPETSALISPVSNCSSIPSDDEEELPSPKSSSSGRRDSRYSCEDCGKSYSTYSGLTKHKQFHCTALGARSFDCKHCDKTYTSLGALKMHIRTHTLPCKCHLCGKAFSRPWLLQGHIRTHTGEKPFQCTECERCFADRSNLRAHLQTHQDVKKYACDQCHKTFSRMSLLTKHVEAACPAGRHSNSENMKNEGSQEPLSPASIPSPNFVDH